MLNVLSFIAAAVLFVAMTVFLAEAWPTPPSLENGLFTLFLLVAVVYYFAGFWRDKRWYALFDDRLCSSAGAFAKDDVEDIVVSKAMYSFRHTQFGVCLITRDGTRYILASRDLSLARMKWLADAMRAWLGKAPWKPSPGDE